MWNWPERRSRASIERCAATPTSDTTMSDGSTNALRESATMSVVTRPCQLTESTHPWGISAGSALLGSGIPSRADVRGSSPTPS